MELPHDLIGRAGGDEHGERRRALEAGDGGLRNGRHAGCERAALSAHIITELFLGDALQLLRDDPRDGVSGPAWREGDDDGDRPRAGTGRLRRAGARRRQQAERAELEAAPTAPVPS
jgi:hypothetical protein